MFGVFGVIICAREEGTGVGAGAPVYSLFQVRLATRGGNCGIPDVTATLVAARICAPRVTVGSGDGGVTAVANGGGREVWRRRGDVCEHCGQCDCGKRDVSVK